MKPLDYLFSLEKLGIKFGLHNIDVLCAALGHPERAYRSVIIAGTNGKGSVTAMVESGLRAAGLRTGRYTSPHLVRVEERFAVNGRPVATAQLEAAVERVPGMVQELRAQGQLQAEPTFFEVTTAVAFDLFRRSGVDVAVLEVGMGGRLDATRAAPAIAAAITTIDFDHEKYLGSTLEAIAAEKAGVIRPGMPVVVGETKPGPFAVIERTCADRGARCIRARDRVETDVSLVEGRTRLVIATPRRRYPPVVLALRGRHQVDNAVVAIRLMEALEDLGIPLDADAILRGLSGVEWRGRLDLVMTPQGPVLLDGAHNPAGAAVLAGYLDEVYAKPLPLVFGAMSDKAIDSILAVLLPRASRFIATRPTTPRARPADEVAAIARAMSGVPIEVIEPAIDALAHAHQYGSPVLVAGSIFLVGDLMAALGASARAV